MKGSQLTTNAVPILVVFFFFVVAILVPLLRVLGYHSSFSRGELITVYVMMLTGSVVVTNGFTGSFLSVITGAQYYATPENDWGEVVIPNLNAWLVPTSAEAIKYLYEGLPSGMAIPWSAWWRPLAAWLSFLFVFYWVTLCIGAILRAQWVENERLVFPLTQLPLAMLGGESGGQARVAAVFRRPLFWLGVAVPAIWHSWNSLANYSDLVQPVPLTGSIALLQGTVGMSFRLHFPALGLGYLMPLNVSMSVWLFYLLGVVQEWILRRIGFDVGGADIWTPGTYPTAMMHEQAGALVVLVAFVLWSARRHLRDFWNRAAEGSPGASSDLLSPRAALAGLAVGAILMVAWMRGTGMSLVVSVLLLLGALVVFIGLSRIVCESGLPGCQSPMVPQTFIMRAFDPDELGLRNMTGLGLSTVWMGETATNMMNAVMHSLRLTSTEDRPLRRLPLAIGLAVVVGLAGSIWMTMHLAYQHGGINLHNWYYGGAARWPFDYLTSVEGNPEASFVPRLSMTAAGGGVMAVLLYLRQRFLWWPLHPIAFPVSATFLINYHWFAVLLAWIIKATVLRYGGVRAFRYLLPLFLGFILGEFATASLWVLIDGAAGVEGNVIFNF